MRADLFQGEKIYLVGLEPEQDAEIFSRWTQNTEYNRLLNTEPAQPHSLAQMRSRMERDGSDPHNFGFGIRPLTEDRLVGFVALEEIDWQDRSAYLAIGIGEPDYWGLGYGTDAVRVILRYAFDVLSLDRVNLDVFEYNQRAYRSYLKAGFVEEGRLRQYLNRDGRRWDLIFMGVLREEWQRLDGG